MEGGINREEGEGGEENQKVGSTENKGDASTSLSSPSAAAEDVHLACVRCSHPAKLQCPKCLELKLPKVNAAFCSQVCFRAAWAIHKLEHRVAESVGEGGEVDGGGAGKKGGGKGGGGGGGSGGGGGEGVGEGGEGTVEAALSKGWLYAVRKGQGRAHTLPSFDWTGPLRPYPISPRRPVPAHIPRPDWAASGRPVEEPMSPWQNSIEIKSPEQIDKLRKTCRVAREALDAAARIIRPGISTDEIDRVVHEFTIAAGGYPSPLNYYFFPKSCCTSINEVVCHGIPDSRLLEDGDIVNVDVTVYLNGVHGDLNETYFVGNVKEESIKLVKTTMECLDKAIAIVKPGVRFREVGEVISRHASANSLSVVKTYCGHGIGELFHCAPNIPHYARNKAVGIMKAGQTFTIEPMINAGVWRDRMWPDGWTAVTADGQRSAQFEHTLLVTETGCEVLTARLPSSPKCFPWLEK